MFTNKAIVTGTRSYVRDTKVYKIKTINNLPEEIYLITINVTSLYTNIPNLGGIIVEREPWTKTPIKPSQ